MAAMVDDTVPAARAAALAGFADTGPGHLNCAQAVVRFAALLLGAREDSVVLARYMGGGMAGMGEVCGALSGAVLSLGLRDQHRGFSPADEVPAPAREQLQQLFRRFEAEFGATACRELVGYRLDSAQAFERFRAEGKRRTCEAYVAWTCDQLADILMTAR
jgi:C_GCAxxG_C_C family probable redox protein